MKRIVITAIAIAAMTLTTTSVNAQSGTRGGGGSSSGGGGGSSSGGGGAVGSAGLGSTSGSVGRSGVALGSRFRDADILNGQSNIIRSGGEASYNRALGVKEYEAARKLYIENQIKIQQHRQAAKDRQETEKYERRVKRQSRLAQQRSEREMKKAMQIANASSIQWPKPLLTSKYDKYRTEIEQLAKLHAELQHNEGVEIGLKTSIRSLAQVIIQDEKVGVIEGDTKQSVRGFIIALNKNHGQFSTDRAMKKMTQKKMIAGM